MQSTKPKPKKASKLVAKNGWTSKIFKPIVTPKQPWGYRGMLQSFDCKSDQPGKYSTQQLFDVHDALETFLNDEIDPEKKKLILAEKAKFENIQWKDGDYGNPKRILETRVTNGQMFCDVYNVDNGQSLEPPEPMLCEKGGDKIWQMAYAENIDSLEFRDTDGEYNVGDSDFDSDNELGGGKKRRIQRTPTNKRNTKKKNTKRKHANNGGADDNQKNPPSPSTSQSAATQAVQTLGNIVQQQQQPQQPHQALNVLFEAIEQQPQQPQQQPPPPEEASDSRTPGGKPKAKMSKTKKRRCKKSSKTKKRNMKRYHNANTKTNRKKRVP